MNDVIHHRNGTETPGIAAPGSVPVMELIGVNKHFGVKHVLKDVDLRIEQGKVTCLLGPSGGGKTTLLKCLDLLTPIDTGEIYFNGNLVVKAAPQDLSPWSAANIVKLLAYGTLADRRFRRQYFVQQHIFRRNLAVVFQEFNLWPHFTVLENLIEGPINAKGVPREEATGRAALLMQKLGLKDVLTKYPRQLSGGQRQRVAIARALIMDASVILADEITSALDPELVAEVLEMLREIASQCVTLVIVTHHLQFAREIADQIVILDEGRVIEQGTPESVLSNPMTDGARKFLGVLKIGR